MVGTASEHRCLRLTPGLLLTLLLAVDCHALFRPVERGPCQAKNPFGPGFSDGVCMPMVKCKETLHGIIRLNFPVVCGFELLTPIVCCPIMNGPAGTALHSNDFRNIINKYSAIHSEEPVLGHGPRESRAPNPLGFLGGIFGHVPGSSNPGPGAGGPFGPYGLNIPGVHSFEDYLGFLGFLPPGQGVGGHNGGGPVHQGFPQDYGKHTGNGQGQHPGGRPHQPDSFGGHNGRPLPGDQGPNTGPRHPDSFGGHNGRPGTGDQGHSSGVEPHNQGSPGGHGRPTRGGQGQGAGSPPQHQGSQGSHTMPNPTDQACQTASGKPGRCVSSSDCPRGPHTPCWTQGFVGDSVCCPTESRHKRAASDFPHDPVLAVLRENRQLCGRSPPTKRDSGSPDFPAEYVLGGKGVNDQKRYPFVVAIFRDEVSVENFWCGGALITRRLVLSAAHCFHKMKNTQFLVRIGSLDISPGRGKPSSGIPMERKVETVLMHPSYNGRQQNADLALLVLDSEAQLKASLRPAACLPLEGAEPDTDTGVILGWGHNAFGGKLQRLLQEADVPLVDNKACDDRYRSLSGYKTVFRSGVDQDFLCAGNLTQGGVDACQHDSGGPLAVRASRDGKSVWELAGVVSFGVQCGTPSYPGVYSRVASFVPWILRTSAHLTNVNDVV